MEDLRLQFLNIEPYFVLHLPSAIAMPLIAIALTTRAARVQSPDDVNSYFVFFSSQKDAAAAGQCIVFNEVHRGLSQHRVAAP